VSIDYYDRNGALFFAGSADADMSRTYAAFLEHVPKGGAILDAGCGSGRDALAFKNAGYAVTAFDGSAKMVELATAHAGLPVQHLRFEEAAWETEFDAIWSCASLLHVPRADLERVMRRLLRALKPGGAWFMSFKHGETERVVEGRYFNDMTPAMLAQVLARLGLAPRDLSISDDARPGREGERWTKAVAVKGDKNAAVVLGAAATEILKSFPGGA
jgi:SAM-dependent methyltransferase